MTPNADRSAACKRAWDTIRANRALKAAGQPVPVSKSAKRPERDYTALIAGWLSGVPATPPAILPELEAVPEPVIVPEEVVLAIAAGPVVLAIAPPAGKPKRKAAAPKAAPTKAKAKKAAKKTAPKKKAAKKAA